MTDDVDSAVEAIKWLATAQRMAADARERRDAAWSRLRRDGMPARVVAERTAECLARAGWSAKQIAQAGVSAANVKARTFLTQKSDPAPGEGSRVSR